MEDAIIKVVVIEDSGFMRILLTDLLNSLGNIELLGTATNGKEGVERVKYLKPDVVISDMIMPQYDGLYVVKTLMKEMPVPIILLSSLDRANPLIFDALKEGAFDFIDKPQNLNLKEEYKSLSDLIKEASGTDYLKLRQRAKGRNLNEHTFSPTLNYEIIVIGASTGGPGAIEYVINNLPCNLTIPIVIAQHMPARFIETFAERLSTGPFKVSVLKNKKELKGNHIYLAPGTENIRLKKDSLGKVYVSYVKEVYKEFNKPSIDCLFESVADVYGEKAIGVILTGMGKDGAKGLLKIKNSGGFTIAQDENSSIVYGMPKAAFDSGATKHQVPLNEIPNFIVSSL
jgi:two-component system, chemotaxis family, protein-glutamate methylesterase/glutaminase